MSEVRMARRGFTLGMLDTHKRNPAFAGQTLYEIMARVEPEGYAARFPDAESLCLLARQHLHSEYTEHWRGSQSIVFLIDAHLPKKDRHIFLREVAKHTRLVPRSA